MSKKKWSEELRDLPYDPTMWDAVKRDLRRGLEAVDRAREFIPELAGPHSVESAVDLLAYHLANARSSPLKLYVFKFTDCIHEYHPVAVSYHWTKAGAYKAMRAHTLNRYAQGQHPNDLPRYKKDRGRKWMHDWEVAVVREVEFKIES